MKIESTNFRDIVTDKDGDTFQIVDHEFEYPKAEMLTKAELLEFFPNANGILSIKPKSSKKSREGSN